MDTFRFFANISPCCRVRGRRDDGATVLRPSARTVAERLEGRQAVASSFQRGSFRCISSVEMQCRGALHQLKVPGFLGGSSADLSFPVRPQVFADIRTDLSQPAFKTTTTATTTKPNHHNDHNDHNNHNNLGSHFGSSTWILPNTQFLRAWVSHRCYLVRDSEIHFEESGAI